MNIRKLIQRRIRHSGGGVDVVADVNAAIAANVNEQGAGSGVSSRQHVAVRDHRTAGARADTSTSSGSREEGGTE